MRPWARRTRRSHGWNVRSQREGPAPFIRTSRWGTRCGATLASRRLSRKSLALLKRLGTRDEPTQILGRTEAAQRLQSCDCLRRGGVVADAGRESDFSFLRHSELGRAACGVAAHYRISGCVDNRMGIRAYARGIEAN